MSLLPEEQGQESPTSLSSQEEKKDDDDPSLLMPPLAPDVADIDEGMGYADYHGAVGWHYISRGLQQTERMGSAEFHARLVARHQELQQRGLQQTERMGSAEFHARLVARHQELQQRTMVDASEESGEEEEITQIADYHGMVARVTRELQQTIVDSSEESGEED
jgi:hypothetical protein